MTALGGDNVLALVVIFAVGLLLCFRRFRTALFVVLASGGGLLLSRLFKDLFNRQRPPDPHPFLHVPPGVPPNYHSFPSGHSMLSAVTYLTVVMIVTVIIPRRSARVFIIVSGLVLVGLIGFSRVYLHAHHLTDVMGGWAFGLTWALLCRWVEKRWVARAERRAAAGSAP
jgi:undecaprenyl-diphosphatase